MADANGSGGSGNIKISAKNILVDGAFGSLMGIPIIGMISSSPAMYSSGSSGSIIIDSESLTLTNGGELKTGTYGSSGSGNITISAKNVWVDGGFEGEQLFVSSSISCQANKNSTSNGGNLNIDTESLKVTNGGTISVHTSGSGDGGDVTIKAKDVLIDGVFKSISSDVDRSMITCQAESAGKGGSLNINTESLKVTNGGVISASTFGSGDGGDVTIKAKVVSIDGGFDSSYGFYPSIINCKSRFVSSGKAGNISFQADTLSMSNGGEISVATYGKKAGGNIDINVANLTMNSGAVISSASTGTGDAGSIMIAANDSMLLNDADITVEANSASAGDIKIQTPNLDMTNTSQITASVSGGSGSGGSIDLNVDTLSITEGSSIESNTAGSGSGDNITVAAGASVTISGKTEEASGMYSTSTGAGLAGSITVKTPTLNISDSGEISSSASGTGPGGSVDINVANLTMTSGAVISSASTGTGDAGNINLTIADKLESRNSTITTESTQADGGDITITNTGFLITYLINSSITATEALVIPTVLFTERIKWRTDVMRELNSEWGGRQWLHFEYVLLKLFDHNARDYYNHRNPVVKILMPRMNYAPEERLEVIRQAYRGLFELTAPMMFDKYVDFIDVYAGIREDEREAIFREITEQEDTVMLAQYIRDKGFQEGELKGGRVLLERLLTRRFGPLPDWGRNQLVGATLDQLNRWADRTLEADSIQAVLAE